MTTVTIEGSYQPCTELARGERREVELTAHVQRLIDRGFVVIVEAAPGHDIGDRRKLSVTVYDDDGELSDCTQLVFTMHEPDDTITTYTWGTDAELVRASLGSYYVYWDCAQAGVHYWRFDATGLIVAAEERSFTVRTSSVL